MSDTAVSLFADTGRPDTAELSRVVARTLVERAGGSVAGLGAPTMQPTRRTNTTPRGAAELVPGDVAALRSAARGLQDLTATAPALADLAEVSAAAHRRLADVVAGLRERAEDIYRRAGELGVGDELWTGSSVLRDQMEAAPEDAEELASLAEQGAALRMAWDGAQIDFVEDLTTVREEFGIPRW